MSGVTNCLSAGDAWANGRGGLSHPLSHNNLRFGGIVTEFCRYVLCFVPDGECNNGFLRGPVSPRSRGIE